MTGSKLRAGLVVATLVVAGIASAQPGDPQPPAVGSGSGSGSGSATGSGSGAGSGSGSGPRIIQLPTDANAPQVSAAASPTVVRLGGKFTLFITATFNEGVEVNLREPLDLGPAFEVTRKLSEDRSAGDGRRQREWQLEVIAWELGDLGLGPIAVTYTAFGRAEQTQSNLVRLRVTGVLGDVVDDPKALRGNAPPTELYARDWFWLYVAIAGVLFVAAVITVYVLIRNRRRRRVVLVGGGFVAPRKFDTARERALARLLQIEQSGLLERDDDRKQGYAEMTETIREYLGSRYRVATFDLTTSELLRALAKHAPGDELRMIERWLERCDIVKYGGLKATTGDAKATLEGARELVLATTQPAKPAVTEPSPEGPQPPPTQPPDGGGGDDDHGADRTERMDRVGEEAA